MKAFLVIDGTHQETGDVACLYRGVHDTEDDDDIFFHRSLVQQFQRQGWATFFTLSFKVERKPE